MVKADYIYPIDLAAPNTIISLRNNLEILEKKDLSNETI